VHAVSRIPPSVAELPLYGNPLSYWASTNSCSEPQVLSVLIGLMGTIVGFYFGATTDTKTTQALAITPASISNQQLKKGDKFSISFVASGGRPPYVYSITFDPATPLSSIKDAKSPDATIKQDFSVPEFAADIEVKFQTSVTDSDNKTVAYQDGTQKVWLRVK
jgi:hypothetical protein